MTFLINGLQAFGHIPWEYLGQYMNFSTHTHTHTHTHIYTLKWIHSWIWFLGVYFFATTHISDFRVIFMKYFLKTIQQKNRKIKNLKPNSLVDIFSLKYLFFSHRASKRKGKNIYVWRKENFSDYRCVCVRWPQDETKESKKVEKYQDVPW